MTSFRDHVSDSSVRILLLIVASSLLMFVSQTVYASYRLPAFQQHLASEGREARQSVKEGVTEIEACGGDWCQLVKVKKGPSTRKLEVPAWDAIFLMFYFFDASPTYVAQLEAEANLVLQKYRSRCLPHSPPTRADAGCVLSALEKRHGFTYWRVNYDIGARCESRFTPTAPYFTNEGDCKPQQ